MKENISRLTLKIDFSKLLSSNEIFLIQFTNHTAKIFENSFPNLHVRIKKSFLDLLLNSVIY